MGIFTESKDPQKVIEPGTKLDVLIAEKVLGLKVVRTTWGKQKQYGCYSLGEPNWYDDAGESKLHNPLPDYSTDMNLAFELLGFFDYVDIRKNAYDGTSWTAYLKSPKVPGRTGCEASSSVSAAHAICLASLLSIGGIIEEEAQDEPSK